MAMSAFRVFFTLWCNETPISTFLAGDLFRHTFWIRKKRRILLLWDDGSCGNACRHQYPTSTLTSPSFQGITTFISVFQRHERILVEILRSVRSVWSHFNHHHITHPGCCDVITVISGCSAQLVELPARKAKGYEPVGFMILLEDSSWLQMICLSVDQF